MLAVKAPHQIKVRIRYVVRGERAIFYAAERDRSYWPGDEHEVLVTDLRTVSAPPSIEHNGFRLLQHRTAVKDLHDAREVERTYYPEAVELAKRLNNATHAIAFGAVARSDRPDSSNGRLPAYGAHVDYGRRTIEDIGRPMLGAQADYWFSRRVVLMNLWRPISTVQRTPLALCDAATVQAEDLHDSEIRGGLDDPNRPPLYGYNLSYSQRHRWYYTSRMQPDELYAFKLYDSDAGQPRWTGHTAIDDPETAADAPPRESIEIRTISFI
ncbi:MAG TPA: CmcJ/NvfI family oxidoreductase [Steroidobacteraceae bacterium]|nr:CmcJ/NvfI family oxidoreductase [Steroidobacteraceae bacterium]